MDKRKLNEIEYLIWSFGQPNYMSMSVTIEGKLDKGRLRNTLDKVQEKHPMLWAQLVTDEHQFPYFIWDKVRKIPIEVIPRRRDDLYEEIVEEEFITPFETGIDSKFPLIRVKLLYSEDKSVIIISLQHVIGDGLSMGFIFRDLLSFYINPPEHIKSVSIVKSIENILPEAIQKKIPRNARRFKVVMWFLKNIYLKYVILKNWLFRRKRDLNITEMGEIEQRNFITNSWVLTKEQTKEFIRKCKKNKVTIHSAICTLFLENFPSINNPVNLRNKLDYPLKDAVGCFAGGVFFSKEYNTNQTFWENAKQYNKKLRKKLNSTE
ncbi:MAG: condensation domain-containing protein, partial [Promethearchaeota archaeon]